MKIIVFRCDRIGDYLLSSILMNNMKKINNNIEFTVVCSKKNSEYVKNSYLAKSILIIPDNLIKRFFFFLKILNLRYDKSIVLDGKKNSIISSILIRCPEKILLTNKKYFHKHLKFFFNKIFYSKKNINKIDELISISHYLNFNFNLENSKYENKINNLSESTLKLLKKIGNFNIFHFDEKWIYNNYIKTYIDIEPTFDQLFKFLERLSFKKNEDLVITTGISSNKLILSLISKFKRYDKNIYEYKLKKTKIFLIEKIDIFNLEYLISKSNCVITCHGAPSHLTNMYNKKLIDIIDESELELFNNWTYHFTNNTSLIRESFSDLSYKIIDKV